MSYVKIGLVLLKIGAIIAMFCLGIRAHQKRSGCTIATFILAAYSAVLVGLIVLDLTTKYIAGYFVLILFSNYLNFLGLIVIMRNLPTREGLGLKKETDIYAWCMHGLYILCIILTIFVIRPKCTHHKVYPMSLNWACCLFLINAIYQFVQHYRNYGLKWEDKEILQNATKHDVYGDCYDHKDAVTGKTESHSMTVDKLEVIFKRMMKWYLWFQIFVACYNVVIQFFGRGFLHSRGDLACLGHGNLWEYETTLGEVFIALHMFCIIT